MIALNLIVDQIVSHTMAEGDWQIGVVNADGTGFHYLKKGGPNKNSFWVNLPGSMSEH
jgi:hypothetical protein